MEGRREAAPAGWPGNEHRPASRSDTASAREATAKVVMEGDLSLLSIPDLLQMICLGGYSRDIHLFDGPVQLGVIAIRHGCVERCFGFGTWGEAAFYKLVNLRRGRYKVNEAQDMGGADATLTAYSWQALLMEAARLQDEAERVVQSATVTGRVIAFPTPASHAAAVDLPAPPPVVMAHAAPTATVSPIALPHIPPPASAAPTRRVSQTMELPAIEEDGPRPTADFAHLLEQATASYLRRDLARAEELLQQCLALRPGDKRVLQNLERVRRKKSP
ncbi:MAG TPA: DUF4388 domain-containing protein [Kofleriaceae bacterium]